MGAVLSQLQNGEEKVISYFSKCLSGSERQYCTTRKELLAVVLAVKHFNHYLFGQNFTVRTDHGSLQWLMKFKNCEGQITRWIEILSTYTLTVVHLAGRVHNNADSLSRRPCHNDPFKFCDRYDKRYSSETLDETNKYTNETGAVKTIDFGSENKLTLPILGSNKQVTLPCIESDKLTLLCTGDEHIHTALNGG